MRSTYSAASREISSRNNENCLWVNQRYTAAQRSKTDAYRWQSAAKTVLYYARRLPTHLAYRKLALSKARARLTLARRATERLSGVCQALGVKRSFCHRMQGMERQQKSQERSQK